jgi:Family of unknown function (DUF6527)
MTGIPLRLIDQPGDAPAEDWRIPGNVWREGEGWAVVLPNRVIWWSGVTAADGASWVTVGEAPNLTVTPSIDATDPPNPWHGWIRDGALRDA